MLAAVLRSLHLDSLESHRIMYGFILVTLAVAGWDYFEYQRFGVEFGVVERTALAAMAVVSTLYIAILVYASVRAKRAPPAPSAERPARGWKWRLNFAFTSMAAGFATFYLVVLGALFIDLRTATMYTQTLMTSSILLNTLVGTLVWSPLVFRFLR